MYCWSRLPSGEVMCTTIIRSGEALRTDEAEPLHVLGQARLGDRDAVLHQHLRLVDVDAGLEGDGDRQRPSPVDCDEM